MTIIIFMMKKILLFSIMLSALLNYSVMPAQIGVGTITPRGALDVNSTTNGFLFPQIALTDNITSAPVINPQTGSTPINGTIIFNTATAGTAGTSVAPGHYYWGGTQWLREATGVDWSKAGNSGTVAGTNFIGTTDAIGLRIRTNNIDRWNISNTNNGQLQSYSLGTALLPAYSFQTDPNTGIFSPGPDKLGATTAGIERMQIDSNGKVGIGTSSPTHRLHVVNDADGQGVMRVDNATAGGFAGMYLFEGANYRGHMGYVNTLGTSGFGGKGAYQLASGDRPLVFSTHASTESFQERMVIAGDGRVGINTNPTNIAPTVQPTSNLQVAGSFAIGVVSVSANTTLTETTCKVILSNGAANITVVLPTPSTCAGRMLSFSRNAASTGTVTIDTAGTNNIQNLAGTVTSTTTIPLHSAGGAGVNVQFWSNGTIWYR
ncbi:hypothetical protein [Flavobacterium sp. GT3R68]|uniref:hypothetical protein n=1 Tax=Flavobacterium sp. GT3R68 TaxID=2594437 RepID=UPI000F86268F|nr:hypothetical protein [Flavobacterium sp. GT3R68]RTY90240.1 hypothetical protein EKL32_21465 [Flavobacterium sp. GSN2]TRW90541.1 hypothetical protein FNW07_10970 [Flavobacterium sp. GT3R68]